MTFQYAHNNTHILFIRKSVDFTVILLTACLNSYLLSFPVSIHSDYLIRHGCHRVLMDVLHAQQLAGKQKWAPAIADVLSVFVNYGRYCC